MAGEAVIERMVVRLLGDASYYEKALSKGIQATQNFVQRVSAKLKAVGRSMKSLGRTLSLRVTAPIVGMGASIFKVGGDFESEMSKIVGLVGVAREQVKSWSQEILELAPSLGKAPTELAKGMFFVTSAGFRGKAAIDVLTRSAKASAGGMGEVETIADAVTSAVNAYGAENLSAARATDVLTAAIREGKLETASLAPTMGRVMPMASKLGIAFEDVAGFMAVMSRTGSDAAEASTSVQAFMMTLLKPTDAAVKLLDTVGISFSDLRDIVREPGGVIDAFRLLNDAFAGSDSVDEALAEIIPNFRALRGTMNALAQDSSIVDSVTRGVADAAGSTEKAFREAATTAKFKLHQALSQLKVLMINVGAVVIPYITKGITKLTQWAKRAAEWWNGLSDGMKMFVIRGLAVAAVVGPILVALGSLVTFVGMVITGITTVVTTLGTALTLLSGPIGIVTAALVAIAAVIGGIAAKGLYNFLSKDKIDVVVREAEKGVKPPQAVEKAIQEGAKPLHKQVTPEMLERAMQGETAAELAREYGRASIEPLVQAMMDRWNSATTWTSGPLFSEEELRKRAEERLKLPQLEAMESRVLGAINWDHTYI